MADTNLRGFDAPVDCGYIAVRAQRAGYSWIGRYYSFNHAKNLSATEATAISRAGLSILSIWEAAGDKYATFAARNGTREAQAAVALARAVGQPNGSAIYFAVDFDASAVQTADGIADYFKSVRAVVTAAGYRVGVYGSGSVCSAMQKAKLADYAMLACAMGWRGSRTYKTADVRQGMPTTLLGVPVDPEVTVRPHEAAGDIGGWALGAKAVSVVKTAGNAAGARPVGRSRKMAA